MKPEDAWQEKRFGIVVHIPAENDRMSITHVQTVQQLRDYKGELAGTALGVMASRLTMTMAGNLNPSWLLARDSTEKIKMTLTVEVEKP